MKFEQQRVFDFLLMPLFFLNTGAMKTEKRYQLLQTRMKSFQESVSPKAESLACQGNSGSEISSRGNGQTKWVEFLPSEVAAIIIHYDLSNDLMNENSSSYLVKYVCWIRWYHLNQVIWDFFFQNNHCGSSIQTFGRCCKESRSEPPPGFCRGL